MRVKRLKELIANASDDAFVVLNGSDHSYRHAYCVDSTTAIVEKRETQIGDAPDWMSEDNHGELGGDEERIQVVVIG